MENTETNYNEQDISNVPYVSNDISHELFVEGVKKKLIKIQFSIKDIDAYKLCLIKRKITIFTIHMICVWLPPILIMFFSFVYSNWWLLIGIILWEVAKNRAHNKDSKIAILLFLATIATWFERGFHLQDYFIFFPLTYILSYLFILIYNVCDTIYVTESFVESPRTYYENVDKILLINKLYKK